MFGIVGLWLLLLLNRAAVCGVLLAVLICLFSQDQPCGRHVEEGLLVLEVMGCLRNFHALSSMYTIQIRSAAHAPLFRPPGMSFNKDFWDNRDATVRFPTHDIFRALRRRLRLPRFFNSAALRALSYCFGDDMRDFKRAEREDIKSG